MIKKHALSKNHFLLTNENHSFGTDAVLLANFAAPRPKETVWDLGTGCGIIPALLDLHFSPSEITGVEISPEACDLFSESLSISSPSSKIKVLCKDIKKIPSEYNNQNLHLVVSNPPYFLENSGKISASEPAQKARHEYQTKFSDFAKSASHLLRYGGRFCFCMKPVRLAEIICILEKYQLTPKRLQMVSNQAEDAPWLFLMEAHKGGKNGLIVEKPLFLRNKDGSFSEKYQEIYHHTKEETQ